MPKEHELVNFVYLSPHFPPNYEAFCVQLRELGVNVLGLAETPFEALSPRLRGVLTEYYRVDDMHSYDQLVRALGYFTHRYGKLDRVESHSEYWLETEARLRTDFNIPGIRQEEISWIKRKSLMKERFRQAGVEAAPGAVARDLDEARAVAAEIGFPLVAKPDIGVGAAATYRLNSLEELERFFEHKPSVDYFLEHYVTGRLLSFDGLTDREGKVVFCASHVFSQGIMEVVSQDDHMYYYSLRDIPADLEEAGRRVLEVFNVRERFFHFEFFRRHSDDRLVALEVNMRPPGGLTTDMFNFANDIDIYREWARLVVTGRFDAAYHRPFHVCYVGRKNNRVYRFSHQEILDHLAYRLCHHEPIQSVFRGAIGDYGYLLRSPELDDVLKAADCILAE